MRLNPSEKLEIIHLVEGSDLSVNRTLRQLVEKVIDRLQKEKAAAQNRQV